MHGRQRPQGRLRSYSGLIGLLVVVASSAVISAAPSSGAAVARTTIPHAASGCGVRRSAGDRTITLRVAGLTRTSVVHLPTGYTGRTRLALVFNLHGSAGDGADQERFTGMDATSNADHFIVAYPSAAIGGGGYYDWDVAETDTNTGTTGNPHDVRFLIDLAADIERKFCVDSTRVYATGYSEGAQMVSELGCDASNVFAAIAPVSGLRQIQPCHAQRPVPILSFHGLDDDIEPFYGGIPVWWTYSVPTALARWVTTDDCASPPIVTTVQPEVQLTDYTDCAGGVSLELYVIATEGHEWPGGPPVTASQLSNLGPQYEGISANNLMWSFFRRYRLR